MASDTTKKAIPGNMHILGSQIKMQNIHKQDPGWARRVVKEKQKQIPPNLKLTLFRSLVVPRVNEVSPL